MLGWALWLRCGESDMLVVHPWNLISKVRISSGAQALEFVRLFSSEDTFASAQLDGMLEVGENNPWCVSLRKALGSLKELRPQVESHVSTEGSRFYITRLVVTYDQVVYRIRESVRDDGFYLEQERTPLLKDLGKLGCLHDAP